MIGLKKKYVCLKKKIQNYYFSNRNKKKFFKIKPIKMSKVLENSEDKEGIKRLLSTENDLRRRSKTEKQKGFEELANDLVFDIENLFKTGFLSDLIIFVGEKKTKFQVHRNILGIRSEYFDSLFHSEMEESKSKELYFQGLVQDFIEKR
jgi:hypothetical protein